MKKNILKTLVIAAFVLTTNGIFAQGAPPPPPSDHGTSGDQPAGGGAPLTGGLGILLALGAAYGGRKVYMAFKNEEKLEE